MVGSKSTAPGHSSCNHCTYNSTGIFFVPFNTKALQYRETESPSRAILLVLLLSLVVFAVTSVLAITLVLLPLAFAVVSVLVITLPALCRCLRTVVRRRRVAILSRESKMGLTATRARNV